MAGALEVAKRALDELGFFSKALEEAKGAKMKSGTPQQWVNTLRKQGVKPAELEATGFNGLLMEQPNAQMAKDDVVKFLTDNRVKLAEPTGRKVDVDKLYYAVGEAKAEMRDAYSAYEGLINSAPDARAAAESPEAKALHDRYLQLGQRYTEATNAYHNARMASAANGTKFDQYTLPGGANYAESKLTIPSPMNRFAVTQPDGQIAPTTPRHWDDESGARAMAERLQGIYGDSYGVKALPGDPLYRSSHWDEPNVVSHYRTKDRIGPNGERVLHVDEVQSDWGQAGRDQGFIDPKAEQQRRELRKQLDDATKARNEAYRAQKDYIQKNHPPTDWDPFDGKIFNHKEFDAKEAARAEAMLADPEYMRLTDELHAAQDRYHPINEAFIDAQKRAASGTIQPGPFVTDTKDWTDLTLKRALLKAEREGYDAIALTPGKEQADRYDLSSQVGRISYAPRNGSLSVYDHNGSLLHAAEDVEPTQLAGMIGKDNAERLMQNRQQGAWGYVHELEPTDMTWGGEGMKAFYDRIVPDRLNKLARQLDPEAALETMPAGRKMSIDYGDGGPQDQTRRVYEYSTDGLGRIPTFSREFQSLDEAEDFVQAAHWPRGGEIPQLPMLRLTPRMKEQLKQGLPLFVGAPAVAGGALSALDQQQAPAGNEFARGGRVQTDGDGKRAAYRAATWSPERYLDTADDRGLVPNYDAIVAGRPVGLDDMLALRNEPPRRKFDDGGYAGADWSGWDGGFGFGSFEAPSASDWAGGSWNGMDLGGGYGSSSGDQTGMITDPTDPAAQYEPGMVAFNPEQSYNDWAATDGQNFDSLGNYTGGNFDPTAPTSPVPDATAYGNFGMFGMNMAGPLNAGLPSMGTPSAQAPSGSASKSSISFDGDLPTDTMMTDLTNLSMPMDMPYASPLDQSDPREQDRERDRAQAFSDIFDPSAPRGLAADPEMKALGDRTVAQERLREAILAEAGNQSIAGKYGVANVIANRADIGFNPGRMGDKTLTGDLGIYNQITPGQFSYLNNNTQQLRDNLSAIRSDVRNMTPASQEAWDIAGRVMSNQVPDNTYGAVNYRNIDESTDKSGYHANLEAKGKVDIGDHTFSGLGSSSRAAYGDISGGLPGRSASLDDAASYLGFAPSDISPDFVASMSTPSMNRPSMTFDQVAPGTLGSGLGFSPFGYAGTPNFDTAMRSIDPIRGTQTWGDLPGGLPTFAATDMARGYDRSAFGYASSPGRSAPSAQDMVNGRPVDSYGFAGPAVAADSPAPRAPGYDTEPVEVRSLPDPAEPPAPDDETPSPSRSPSMNERIAGWMGATDRRNVDPLTRQVYDPVTGYTYPVDPLTVGKGVDMVAGLIPGFGLVNGVSRLLGGPSLGGVMAQGAPGGWDSLTAADASDRSFGGSGADNRQAYDVPSTPASIPIPPPVSTDKPMTNAEMLAYLRRRYLGEDADPKTYGMRAQRNYFSYE